MRNTLELAAVPSVKERAPFPVLVDRSHGTGRPSLIAPMALAAATASADGVMVDVHNDRKAALSDGEQALTPGMFDEFVALLEPVLAAVRRPLAREEATVTTDMPVPTAGRRKPEGVRSMFRRLAGRYDRANSVLSLGMHYRWRRAAVKELAAAVSVRERVHVVDGATGIGDFAFALARVLGPTVAITASDFREPMRDLARRKLLANGGFIRFEPEDRTALPYADGTFDGVTVGFRVRNVGDFRKALRELWRVLRPAGRLVVLEFGEGQGGGLEALRVFLKGWLPFVGGRVTGDGEAYA
jgi:demethylmenaquinone methyltransferase/2-methoxy-6-polyprenyl-1,4-benzoquinol methylase